MYDKPVERHREFLLNTDYINNGLQHRYKFNNNYGASVVKHDFSYGGKNGLWELAVLDFTVDKLGAITYHTPITQDVIGHLAWNNVESILQEIKEL
tara:strand:+ start:74 stop:361 length:288 start_codon:yes stop_codon:yes gene_type:complete